MTIYEAPGVCDGYAWLESPSAFMSAVLPTILTRLGGQYLVITSLDSGKPTPTGDERAAGWCEHAAGMMSPALTSDLEIPWDQYDEWWIFENRSEASLFPRVDPFVNRGGWSLRTPSELTASYDPTWERDVFDWLIPVQAKFWRLVDDWRPSAYVSEGDGLVLVSRDAVLLRGAREALQTRA